MLFRSQDSITPIEGAWVTFSGIGESGDTLVYQFITDTLGCYGDSVAYGTFSVWVTAEGYQTVFLPDSLHLFEGLFLDSIDFVLYESYHPVHYVAARHYNNDLVRVSWSMHDPQLNEDFETGDFSRFNWDNTLSDYPWVIDTVHAYEGTCCMKSSCEGQGRKMTRDNHCLAPC